MDNTNSINKKIISFVFIFLLVGTSSVLALGISTPYWKDHPLEMYPGQTKEVSFLLVNKVGNPTADAFVTLTKSAEIAKIISGSEYSVPAEARDVNVVLQINVPENANIGDTYDIEFSIKAIPEENQGGNVQLGVGYGVKFPVKVIDKSEALPEPIQTQTPQPQAKEINTTAIIIGLIVLIVFAIIIFVILKRKKQA